MTTSPLLLLLSDLLTDDMRAKAAADVRKFDRGEPGSKLAEVLPLYRDSVDYPGSVPDVINDLVRTGHLDQETADRVCTKLRG